MLKRCLEMLFPAFWEQFKRKINFINSDTIGHDRMHNKKVCVPNCCNIWGAGPHFCYWARLPLLTSL